MRERAGFCTDMASGMYLFLADSRDRRTVSTNGLLCYPVDLLLYSTGPQRLKGAFFRWSR